MGSSMERDSTENWEEKRMDGQRHTEQSWIYGQHFASFQNFKFEKQKRKIFGNSHSGDKSVRFSIHANIDLLVFFFVKFQ